MKPPASDLLTVLRCEIADDDEFEQCEIVIDVPVRVYLRPTQIEQLVEKLARLSEGAQ